MSFMNKILVFNKPQKEVDCCQCKGTGKVKTQRVAGSTQFFCVVISVVFFISFIDLVGEFPSYWIAIPTLVISAIAGIMSLVEYKKQTMMESLESK